MGKVSKKTYIEYLIHTPINYTGSNLAFHLQNVSHDAVSDFLNRGKATSRQIWELSQGIICNKIDGYVIVDDSVQDKNYSKNIELAKYQYSGNEHDIIRGIGVINLVHYHKDSGFNPIDYRIYAPMQDGKTKNEHARDMVINAKNDKGILAKTMLMDSYYASVENIKIIHRMGLIFVSQLKSNRLVSLTPKGGYIHMQDLDWNSKALTKGISVKLKEVPFRLRLFKVVAPNGDIDWVVTNHSESVTSEVVQQENDIRWKIEEMHRELKQLTGIEKCQARKSRIQRNHISFAYQAWFALKRQARLTGLTIYQVKNNLYSTYLKSALLNPVVPAYHLCL